MPVLNQFFDNYIHYWTEVRAIQHDTKRKIAYLIFDETYKSNNSTMVVTGIDWIVPFEGRDKPIFKVKDFSLDGYISFGSISFETEVDVILQPDRCFDSGCRLEVYRSGYIAELQEHYKRFN